MKFCSSLGEGIILRAIAQNITFALQPCAFAIQPIWTQRSARAICAAMQIRLEYRPTRGFSPLTPWVHIGVDGPFHQATQFDPPLPGAVHRKGYPAWFIDHRGRSLVFVSPEEIAHAIDILGRKILPATRDLGMPYRAVNSHWLSRLHKSFKPWKVRQELVKRLRSAPQA